MPPHPISCKSISARKGHKGACLRELVCVPACLHVYMRACVMVVGRGGVGVGVGVGARV